MDRISEETVVQIKAKRRTQQEEVGELCVDLDLLIESSATAEEVEILVTSVKEAFQNLCDTHEQLVHRLTDENQDTKGFIRRQENAQKMVQSALQRAKSFLTPSIDVAAGDGPQVAEGRMSAPEQSDDDLMRGFIKFMSKATLELPKPQLIEFDGNQADYCKFIHCFDTNVASKPIEERSKLNYLIQLCKGEAKRLIEPYVFVDGSEGYLQARMALEKRYGKKHKVVRAHVETLTKGKPLRPGSRDDLFRFLEDLTATKITLGSMGKEGELNNDDIMKKLVLRLPTGLRRKWVTHSVQVAKRKGREGNFHDFLTFIEDIGEEYNSMYSVEALGEDKAVGGNRVRDNQSHYLSDTTPTSKNNCQLCSEHCLCISQCPEFLKSNVRERLALVRRLHLCMFCLKPGHLVRACRKAKKCTVPDCTYTHHNLLHEWVTGPPKAAHRPTSAGGVHCTKVNSVQPNYKVSLAVVPVTIRGYCGKLVHTYALLDSGSDVSLVDEKLLDELHIKGKRTAYSITTVNSKRSCQNGKQVYLDVRPYGGGSYVRVNKLLSVSNLPVSLSGLPTTEELQVYDHLKDVQLPKIHGGKVSMLIGSDVPELVVPYEVRRGPPSQPCAMRCRLGWVVLGKLPTVSGNMSANGQTHFIQELASPSHEQELHDDLSKQVMRLWETDYSEVSSETKCMSQEDIVALKQITDSTKVIDGHYEIGLPFNEEVSSLPNDYGMALKRLYSLKSKLCKDPSLKDMYTTAVSKYIADGHARKLDPTEVSKNSPRAWYIPHQPVVNVNKPGKVRVVFDCAAQFLGKSLNGALRSGPDLVNSLAGVLLRFRQEEVALAADIEAMFHQVRVPLTDQQSLRFLWYEDGDFSKDPSIYCMTVHLFGARSSPTCASFALRRAATDQEGEFSEKAINTILNNFYVDDCLKSIQTEDEAIMLVKQVKTLLANRGFNLTKWVSNSQRVLDTIPDEDKAPDAQISLDGEELERTLGVKWNVSEDSFTFEVAPKDKPMTRRGILSVVSSIFDPLGFVAPMTLGAKKLIQDLTKLKVSWDEEVPDQIKTRWSQWLTNLSNISGLKVKRCIKPEGQGEPINIQLHIFADASEVGYGVVAYIRSVTATSVTCRLVMGKSRLAPVKRVSIPRLELMAAVLASKVKSMLVHELDIQLDEVWLWTDSTIVLAYIQNTTSRFKTFVANRLVEIHDRTEVSNWKHVPGHLNPADLASRGFHASDSGKCHTWLNGPKFLKEAEDKWPQSNPDVKYEEDLEVRTTLNVNAIGTDNQVTTGMSYIWNMYSSFLKLKKVIAQCLRFKNNLMARCSLKGRHAQSGSLTVQEVEQAETAIIQAVQNEVYNDEVKRLNKGLAVKLTSSIVRLNPQLHDGLIKISGRIGTSIDESPKVLPGNHAVAKLIIAEAHTKVGHLGLSSTLTEVRDSYWLTKGVASVRSVLSKCIPCKRQHARPVKQIMATLPEVRLTPNQPPFLNVGMDFFGPFPVRQKRSIVKRYGMIFVCMATRAVHIEVTHSLDTNSVLMGLTRFRSRRGKPKSVYCDNGTSIVKADKELAEELKCLQKGKIYQDCLSQGIEFVYRAPLCSSMGGVYERMIRSVRSILFSLSRQQTLDEERLITLVSQVEMILNSRPITQINSSVDDPAPLTPNMLLLMRSNKAIPEAVGKETDNYHQRRWAQIHYLSDIFWHRWVKEYLPSLRARQKWLRETNPVKKGDLVLLQEPNCHRGLWPLALVIETIVSHDGIVRACIVKRGNSACHLKRALSSICLLEAC